MSTLRTLILSLSVLAAAAPAVLAQPKGDDKKGDDQKGSGDTVELGNDDDSGDSSGSLGDGTGAEENPGAPQLVGEELTKKKVEPRAAEPGEYPLELSQRPLTLYAGMSEASISLATNPAADSFLAYGAVRASYGVTREAQLSLAYGAGALVGSNFVTGKTVGVDARYSIFSWLSGQLAVPFLLDPIAFGVTLGAPMKFRFDKFALFVGEDLVSIKLHRFIPDVGNAGITDVSIAADKIGTESHSAEFHFVGGVIYQVKPNLAFTGRIGVVQRVNAPNSTNASSMPISGQLTWSKSNKLDAGARIFIDDLSEVGNTFGLGVFAALRI